MTVFLKPLAGLSLLLAVPIPSSASFIKDHSAIVRVDCTTGSGTAFRVGKHLLLSVRHVTSLSGCEIDGEPIKVIYSNPKQDFTILSSDEDGETMTVDCGGFIKGRTYLANGFARGLDVTTSVELEGTGEKIGPLSVLGGTFTVIPGMSGGPILDESSGKVVGTVNTYNYEEGLSGSVALRDTPVCRHA